MSEEEMKALVEMNNMLKHENTKLKQDKQVVKQQMANIRKECFNRITQKYEEYEENDEANFLNFQLLTLIDEVLEKLGE